MHLIVEAAGARALTNAVRAFSIRLARGLDGLMGGAGRWSRAATTHVLSTPAEVRNSLRYVVRNFASHAARRGEPMRSGWVDPFSGAVKAPRAAQEVLFAEAATRWPETWLLRAATPRVQALDISSPESAQRSAL